MSQAGQPEHPHPSLKAILLCERAIREQGTGKVTLVGIFDRIGTEHFPADYVSGMSIYARMTDAQGMYRFRLELVRLEDEQAVGRGEMEAVVEDRLRTSEVTFDLQRLRFERPGSYEFRLFANDRYLGSLPLDVVQEPQEPQHG